MFGKLFVSMYDGTLASNGPWQALVTFQQLIILADQDGNVDMTPQAIARRTSIPLNIITEGLVELAKPDPFSRTPDEQGRRIVLLEDHRPWGWRLVNYEKYRQQRKAEDRREYLRIKQRESRERRALLEGKASTGVNKSSTKINASTKVEVEEEVEAEAIQPSARRSSASRSTDTPSGETLGGAAPQPAPRRRKAPGEAAPSAHAWVAYAEAYQARYGALPVRNAAVNGQLAQLVARIGAEEAPHVAAFYLTHRNGLYVNAMHPVNLLLRDCEKLRTEWATKTQMTRTQATMADRTQTNLNSFGPLIAAAEARERADREQ